MTLPAMRAAGIEAACEPSPGDPLGQSDANGELVERARTPTGDGVERLTGTGAQSFAGATRELPDCGEDEQDGARGQHRAHSVATLLSRLIAAKPPI